MAEDKLLNLFQEVLWKKSEFSKGLSKPFNNEKKAQALREMIMLMSLHQKKKHLPYECLDELLWRAMKEYGEVMDDLKHGNSSFNEALQMAGNRAADASQWISSLEEFAIDDIVSSCLSKEYQPWEPNYDLDEAQTYLKSSSENLSSSTATIPAQSTDHERSNPSSFIESSSIVSNYSHQHNKRSKFKPNQNTYSKREEESTQSDEAETRGEFRTAKVALAEECKKSGRPFHYPNSNNGNRKTLGTISRSNIFRKFVSPLNDGNKRNDDMKEINQSNKSSGLTTVDGNFEFCVGGKTYSLNGEYLKNIDHKMIEIMMNEILDLGAPVSWDDVAGLEFAKEAIKEIVIWPLLRPDLFMGLRLPHKGVLLFGPPGTGKTLIGKCIASQCKSTFFSMSASSLTSKWIGEGEKLVRALFAVARSLQPSVVFIDEIDSLLTQRSDTEHESSRRLKTEFLVQLDGANSSSEDRILILGATNRPQELDEAARRRLGKRLYVPLPERNARQTIVERLMSQFPNTLSSSDLEDICFKTQGYSGADMSNLCKEASLGPIREIKDIQNIPFEQLRPIEMKDFESALMQVKASVSESDLSVYQEWNQKFGSWSHPNVA